MPRQNRSLQAQAVVAILSTADAIRRAISKPVEAKGLSFQQYNVLRTLREAGKAGLPTLDIVDRLVESAPAITRLLDKLEAKGLVRRIRDTEDRRRVLCYITPAGRTLVESLDQPVLESDKRAVAGLSTSKLPQLLEMLTAIRRGLNE